MTRKKWRWCDSPPRGTVEWMRSCIEQARKLDEQHRAKHLEKVDSGAMTLEQAVRFEKDYGAYDRTKDLLRYLLYAFEPEERDELDQWIRQGSAATAGLIERMRAPGNDPWLLAELLTATGRHEESGALVAELSEAAKRRREALEEKLRQMPEAMAHVDLSTSPKG